jgi:hypothetical protein
VDLVQASLDGLILGLQHRLTSNDLMQEVLRTQRLAGSRWGGGE